MKGSNRHKEEKGGKHTMNPQMGTIVIIVTQTVFSPMTYWSVDRDPFNIQ